MVPIHDTDVAEERWRQSEWRHFEFWEEVEVRFRRKKKLLIGLAILLFLLLSSVPVVQNKILYWRAQIAIRNLAYEMSRMKRDAGIEHAAFKVRFPQSGALTLQVEKLSRCQDSSGEVVRTVNLLSDKLVSTFQLITPAQGESLGIPGLAKEFCYDPLSGSDFHTQGIQRVGFAILPVKDLAEHKTDRLSLLLLQGPSAEFSFD